MLINAALVLQNPFLTKGSPASKCNASKDVYFTTKTLFFIDFDSDSNLKFARDFAPLNRVAGVHFGPGIVDCIAGITLRPVQAHPDKKKRF